MSKITQKTVNFLLNFLENNELYEIIKTTPQFHDFLLSLQRLDDKKKQRICDELKKRYGFSVDKEHLVEFTTTNKNAVYVMRIISEGVLRES